MRLRDRLHRLECTALLLDTEETAPQARSLLGGIVRLERRTPVYGGDRRAVQIVKMRGHEYTSGLHDLRIRRGGLAVYPRLVAAEHRDRFEPEVFSSGLAEFDAMLGGGLDRGAAVLLLGPTGTGKSTLAIQCASEAAARGERALLCVFDERLQTVFQRAAGIGIELEGALESGRIAIRQVDPAELTPGEFAEELRYEALERGTRLVVLDSLNAYLYAMPEERLLDVHLHELLAHLSQAGVTSLLTATQHGLGVSQRTPAEFDLSYLADTVVLLQHVQRAGRFGKAIAVYKRRAGSHEDTVRELRLEPGGISVGEILPLGSFSYELGRAGSLEGDPGRGP
jgi:circadian clock protein KaiC